MNPLSGEAVSNLTLSYLATGDYKQALAQSIHNQEVLPSWPTARFYQGLALYHQGRFLDAQNVLTDLSVNWTKSGAESTLALTYIALGDEISARKVLAGIQKGVDYFSIALVYAALGEKEMALETFNKVENWGPWAALAMRRFFPEILDSLHSDPRYPLLLDEMHRNWGIEP